MSRCVARVTVFIKGFSIYEEIVPVEKLPQDLDAAFDVGTALLASTGTLLEVEIEEGVRFAHSKELEAYILHKFLEKYGRDLLRVLEPEWIKLDYEIVNIAAEYRGE